MSASLLGGLVEQVGHQGLQRRAFRLRREQRRALGALLGEAVQQAVGPALFGTAAAQQRGEAGGVAAFEIAFVAPAEHADVAVDARGDDRRARARGFHHHVGAAFGAAGVHQHVRGLDAAARGRVRQAAEPAVVRAGGHGGARFVAERGFQRVAGVVDQDAFGIAEQARGGEQGLRVLDGAQVADHQRAQVARGLGERAAGRGGLEDGARLGAVLGRQGGDAECLQHDQRLREVDRAARLAVRRVAGAEVVVEVGAGEDDGQPRRSALFMPGSDGGGRAAGVQGDQHAVARRGVGIRPRAHHAHRPAPFEEMLPAPRGLPVAVVGIGEGGGDNHDSRRVLRLPLAGNSCVSGAHR
jgi:hypothetical protein